MRINQLLVVVILVVFQGWGCYSCLEEERTALLQLKISAGDLSADSFSGWVDGGDCCDWVRVECNSTSKRVIQLSFDGIRDSGWRELQNWYLNTSLFLPFKEIKSLDLSSNGIGGCVENQGFERLSVLENLENLNLNDNRLDGSIISPLSTFSSLKILNLSRNNIQGLIDIEELNNLTSLNSLDLGSNRIQGFKSFQDEEEKLKLKNLEILDLSNNLFDTRLLSCVWGLLSLKILNLGRNQMKGSMNITGLNTLRSLEKLDLSGNEIGQFVAWIAGEGLLQLSNLESLDLSNNTFNNSILSSLEELSSLKELRLDRNDFKGGAMNMKGLLKLIKLQTLGLSYNRFDNSILLSVKELLSLKNLDLGYNYLKGAINMEAFRKMSNLEWLNVRGNKITKIVGFRGPSNLTNLKTMDLSENNLEGPIFDPDSQNFVKLENLYMDHSLLDKNAFRSLGSLPCLKTLSLNRVTATIPADGLPSLKNLESLDLNGSNITNSFLILKTIRRMSSLTSLGLTNCGLSGTIPITNEGLCQLKHLEVLHMHNNDLSGVLPSCLTIMTSLQILDVSSNHLGGNILSSMGEMSSLSYLDLSDNQLQGGIPMTLSNCSLLRNLDVSNNNLSGRIPEWMGNMSNLQYLDLSQNSFFGTLPHNFNPSLQFFFVSENNMKGSFNNAFCNCFKLRILDLSDNNFTGGIPSWIRFLSHLRFLLLSYNNLTGEIPKELSKLHLLSLIDLSNNNISCQIKFVIRSANDHRYISGIDFSCNNLKGEIPPEFGNFYFINILNLSHNSLTGEIPSTFSNLRDMESLDLSFNNLNGSIPLQLTELQVLSIFNVAHNNLSGKIPERIAQFATFEEDSFKDNVFLCGPPLPRDCSENESPPSIPKNSISEGNNEWIDMDDFWVTFVVSYAVEFLASGVVLYINPRWRRAWFYLVEYNITNCYYFIIDNVPFLSKSGL